MKLICIVGPTGSGKNRVALYLANKFKGEIINFDSRQLYKGCYIVTAQPSEEEKKICAHHLYGFLDLDKNLSAGKFAEIAEGKIQEVVNRGHVPILVGGTGLYLKAILYGLAPIPTVPDKIRMQVIKQYQELGPDKMYSLLKDVDPDYANKIHPRDKQRITRSLEVYYHTGKNITWFHKNFPTKESKYNYIKIGIWLDRQELEKRLKQRIHEMIGAGGIDEVKTAWEQYPDRKLPVWTSIGCGELLDFLHGKYSFDQAINIWIKNTRQYAKRQLTWFKREKDIIWLKGDILNGAKKNVERFLNED